MVDQADCYSCDEDDLSLRHRTPSDAIAAWWRAHMQPSEPYDVLEVYVWKGEALSDEALSAHVAAAVRSFEDSFAANYSDDPSPALPREVAQALRAAWLAAAKSNVLRFRRIATRAYGAEQVRHAVERSQSTSSAA